MKSTGLLSGIEISSEQEDLICYSYDSSYAEPVLPYAVAWPRKTEEVCRLVRYAADNALSIIPRGAGTGMVGSSVPQNQRCIVVSIEKMRRMIEIDRSNMIAVVEPGILNGWLQKELDILGFFYPPDPSSLNTCTIGGNVATNAGGPRALKYGVTRDYVLEIEAVLPDGSVINVGGRTYKRVVGYDLKELLVGSEGTLAVITKVCLRILPLPEDLVTLLALFNNLGTAGTAVSRILGAKVIPRTMEFLDRSSLDAVEQYKHTGLPTDVEALLLIEVDGYPATISREAERIVDIVRSLGGEAVVAQDERARQRLWEARRAISPALYRLMPSKINQDIVVPRTNIPALFTEVQRLSDETGIKIVSFGHAGDGNIHVNIMIDVNDPEEHRKAQALVKRVFETAVNLGGSISGEHGIGILKKPYIGLEVKDRELSLMREIKKTFDPSGMMNPGKIFP